MMRKVEIVTVDAANVTQYGFFCYKSKPKSEGYHRKLDWLRQRFAEGMKVKIVYEGGSPAGFIEYIPGEFAWRAVQAKGYLLIHCLWVVGRNKDQGYGSRLLDECIQDARKAGLRGVAMVTSSRNWLAGSELLLKHGFESVEAAPPSFELMALRFGKSRSPSFPKDWDERLRKCVSGLTVFRSDQCPYLEAAVNVALETGREMGIKTRVVELESAKDVRELSPSPYGVFGLVYNGKLLAYHIVGQKELVRRLNETSPSD